MDCTRDLKHCTRAHKAKREILQCILLINVGLDFGMNTLVGIHHPQFHLRSFLPLIASCNWDEATMEITDFFVLMINSHPAFMFSEWRMSLGDWGRMRGVR